MNTTLMKDIYEVRKEEFQPLRSLHLQTLLKQSLKSQRFRVISFLSTLFLLSVRH